MAEDKAKLMCVVEKGLLPPFSLLSLFPQSLAHIKLSFQDIP